MTAWHGVIESAKKKYMVQYSNGRMNDVYRFGDIHSQTLMEERGGKLILVSLSFFDGFCAAS